MQDVDLTEDLMDELFAERDHSMMITLRADPEDAEISRMIRSMDRGIKMKCSRPSNDHASNPRRKK